MDNNKFQFLQSNFEDAEITRPSLTFWQDAWRRLRKHKLAMVGLITIFLVILFAIFGPMISAYNYSDQLNQYRNLGPKIDVFKIDDNRWLHFSKDYNFYLLDDDFKFIKRLKLDPLRRDIKNKIYYYVIDAKTKDEVKLDFSFNTLPGKQGYDYDQVVEYKGKTFTNIKEKRVRNSKFYFGSDDLGRDILTRIMYGARISMIIAFVATLVNVFIGVIYGAIAGYEGGRTDNIMMRIVDIINSIPLTLYVILIMVSLPKQEGFTNIIIAISTVYWVTTARLVRGQMLSIKEQEFVLAARTIGVPKSKIIAKHLIPNAIGPIIVSMAMMIPGAIFTEAFLSFIGLGVSMPQASLGTLANEALATITTYPYQIVYPSVAIAIIILAFNFLGDGLRDALDPRLRQG